VGPGNAVPLPFCPTSDLLSLPSGCLQFLLHFASFIQGGRSNKGAPRKFVHKVIHSPCRQPDRPPLPVFPLRPSPLIRLSPNSKPSFFAAIQPVRAHHCATFRHGRHECTATDWPASVPSGTLRSSCYTRIRPAPRQEHLLRSFAAISIPAMIWP